MKKYVGMEKYIEEGKNVSEKIYGTERVCHVFITVEYHETGNQRIMCVLIN